MVKPFVDCINCNEHCIQLTSDGKCPTYNKVYDMSITIKETVKSNKINAGDVVTMGDGTSIFGIVYHATHFGISGNGHTSDLRIAWINGASTSLLIDIRKFQGSITID